MRLTRVLVLAALVAGCDDPTAISHVDRLPGIEISDLWTKQDSRGIPVEVHGAPFAHVTDQALAEALRAPTERAGELEFYAAPVGSWQGSDAWRLVLHFNPQGPPNAYADCKLVAEARANPRPGRSFTVTAAFCRQDQWQAHGYLVVRDIEPGDLGAFADAMQTLMRAIFGEKEGRQNP